ncbi:MAG: cytochrome c biogenesis protein [Methanotrichaceae archaeon]|nr:cytochrome c biogenesis protein [Methanotrichaceae archaeon]
MISHKKKRQTAALIFLFAVAALSLFSLTAFAGEAGETSRDGETGVAIKAPQFTAVGVDGNNFSLSDFAGSPLILHITNIEVPLCVECEESLQGQVEELARLKAKDPAVQIVTLNLRKNPYSREGKPLAEKWWKVNITWPWAEDIEPYAIGSKYLDYWNVRGGSSNPTLLLIDKEGNVAGVYHVYRVGEGKLDGVQSAETLYEKLQDVDGSKWKGLEGEALTQEVTAFGMFGLGIMTSLAPCSIALMIAVFSYVMTVRRKDEYLKKSASTSREGFMMGIAFTLGMAAVFFVLGLFISQAGLFIRDSKLFDLMAGVIMILLGISNLKPLEEILEPVTSRLRPDRGEYCETKKSLLQRSVETSIALFKHSAFLGAFTLGIFFALGWAPCALSMVLPVLIWLASQNVTPLAGGMMLFIFGVGHGVPIIPIATFSRTIGGRIGEKYVSIGAWTTKFFGLLVIVVGVVYAARYAGFLLW